jgi:hypothetical protein
MDDEVAVWFMFFCVQLEWRQRNINAQSRFLLARMHATGRMLVDACFFTHILNAEEE